MNSEPELIKRAINGDKQAFGELAITYRKNICGLAYRLIGDLHEAEDITQNVFIRAFLALPGFKPIHEGAFKSWLLTITSRLCVDHMRRHHNRDTLGEIQPFQELDLISTADTIPDIIVENENKRILREALLRLPPNYRMAIALKYIEELDYREIAVTMKIPIGTVGTWIRRGLEQMKKELNTKGGKVNEELASRSL